MNKHEEHILLKTTSFIKMCDDKKNELSYATCFFCKNKNDTLYFVTNNHVIEKSDYCLLHLSLIDKTSSEHHIEDVFCELKGHVIKHNQYDLCIVDITHVYNKLISEGKEPIISYIPTESIISDFGIFSHIEEIYMIGYPNCLINDDINYPIVRKGITATGLCDTLDGLHAFIIDIPVYGGSSGSPIYYITDDKHVKLVGITSKKYCERNNVFKIKNNAFCENKSEHVKVPNGLGYAIKSNIILELLSSIRN